MFFDPGARELLRTRPGPLTSEQVTRIPGAGPAGPPRARPPSRSPSSAGPATPA
jgi:hypothetical protein